MVTIPHRMIALQYRFSIPRYLGAKVLGRLSPHRFFQTVSPLRAMRMAVPNLPGPEWALVKVEGCGICGSDLNALRGMESYSMEPYASFPAIMGHEIIGHVVKCGAAASSVSEGSRVAVENILPCATRGIAPPCSYCDEGSYSLCSNFTSGDLPPGVITGFTNSVGGGWGEYLVAHRSQLFPVPDHLPLAEAVLIDSLASAWQPVADHTPSNDQTVLVYGAGIIGLNVVQSLRAVGFTGRIITVARHSFQAGWAEQLGATNIIRGPLLQEIARLTDARVYKTTLGPPVLEGGVDLVFDCVGSAQTIDNSLRVVRKRGKVVVVGTATSLKGVDAAPLWFKEVRLTGSAMFSHSTVRGVRKRTYQHVIDAICDGRLHTQNLVTHTFPIRDYAHALNVALNKKRYESIKIAFVPSSTK